MAMHGTKAGYQGGCTTRSGCRFDRDSPFLSCCEAATARRRDHQLSRLPPDRLLPREGREAEAIALLSAAIIEKHGSTWGYRRGCRTHRSCPHLALGLPTCAEAKRHYYRRYAELRRNGAGTPIDHGSREGYELGCRGSQVCPGDASGRTCAHARAAHRLSQRRKKGVLPQQVCGREAVTRVIELHEAGLSLRTIAALAGVGRTTISGLMARSTGHVQHESRTDVTVSLNTRAAILAIHVGDAASSASVDGRSGPPPAAADEAPHR